MANDIQKSELEKELKAKYGLEIGKIEYKKLKNGVDIIAFYDPSFGRKRLIDYSYAKSSLLNEFTNIQNNNVMYQTDDYEKNAIDIARAEADKNLDREFDMIDIERFKANYDELIKRIPAEDQDKVEMLNELLNQSESRNLKYINIENMVALDDQGNIVEASFNRENEVQVGGVANYQREVDTVDNEAYIENQEEIMPTEYESSEEIVLPEEENIDEEFKKTVEEEMEKHQIQGDLEEEYKKVVEYAKDLNNLESDYERQVINENQYEFYKDLTEDYTKTKSLNETMSLSYGPGKQFGYVFTMILAVISIVIGIITLILISLSKM